MSQNEDVQRWWAENPMTYGSVHGQPDWSGEAHEMGSVEFFQRLDEEFYSWCLPLHDKQPFDRVFPYCMYTNGARVLEIGCGMGTMAMNWAKNGAHVTAVDLNAVSIRETRNRFSLFGLEGDIRQMDATKLAFESESFDYVYSWGVLHHSPNLQTSLSEMMRVLRPAGRFGLMLYSRDSIRYWYRMRYVEEFLHYEGRFLSPLELASRYTDAEEAEGNMHTWPVTEQEIRGMVRSQVTDIAFRRFGGELDGIFKRLVPGLGLILPLVVKKAWARRYGWSIWAEGKKI